MRCAPVDASQSSFATDGLVFALKCNHLQYKVVCTHDLAIHTPIPLHESRNIQASDGLRECKLLILITPRIASGLRAIDLKLLIWKN